MIPKILWTYWEGPRPEYIGMCLESIQQRSGVEVRILDPTNVEQWLPQSLNGNWRHITIASQRADALRIAILRTHGGLWCDADTLMLRSLSHLFDREEQFIGMRWEHNNRLLNGYFLAQPECVFLTQALEVLNEILKNRKTDYGGGGCVLGEDIFLRCGSDIGSMPLATFCPINFPVTPSIWFDERTAHEFVTADTVAIALNHSHFDSRIRGTRVSEIQTWPNLIGSVMRQNDLADIKDKTIARIAGNSPREWYQLSVDAVTPYVREVVVPGQDGEVGVLPDHDVLLEVVPGDVWRPEQLEQVLCFAKQNLHTANQVEVDRIFLARHLMQQYQTLSEPAVTLPGPEGGKDVVVKAPGAVHNLRMVRVYLRDAYQGFVAERVRQGSEIKSFQWFVVNVWNKYTAINDIPAAERCFLALPSAVVSSDLGKSLLQGYVRVEAQPKKVRAAEVGVQKRKSPFVNVGGNLCVFTVVDQAYLWYVPLFIYSLHIELPQVRVVIGVRGDEQLPTELLLGATVFRVADGPAGNGWTTRAMRFLVGDDELRGFDYVLITDVDLLIYKEPISIINQHVTFMQREGTGCYENWVEAQRGSDIQLSGVHFVTREWWDRTAPARKHELQKLETEPASEWGYDEWMLGRIVLQSGLMVPPSKPKLWRNHGVHLGEWRRPQFSKKNPQVDAWQGMHIQKLLRDPVWAAATQICGEKIPFISETMKRWPLLFRG